MRQDGIDIGRLQRRVDLSAFVALVIFALVVAVYIYKHWWIQGGSLADSPDIWGQFGDYIGGLLNPLLAFLAFYWLTQSVLLQKEQLLEAREALEKGREEQKNQAKITSRSFELDALNSLILFYNNDIARLEAEVADVQGQIDKAGEEKLGVVRLPRGEKVPVAEAPEKVEVIRMELKEITRRRRDAVLRIEMIF